MSFVLSGLLLEGRLCSSVIIINLFIDKFGYMNDIKFEINIFQKWLESLLGKIKKRKSRNKMPMPKK